MRNLLRSLALLGLVCCSSPGGGADAPARHVGLLELDHQDSQIARAFDGASKHAQLVMILSPT